MESARRVSARAVNPIMTATYWEIGRRIVESEQQGRRRAGYGEALLKNLAFDLTAQFGRGFGLANLKNIRKFYLTWPLGAQLARRRLTYPRPSESALHLTKKARHCLAFLKRVRDLRGSGSWLAVFLSLGLITCAYWQSPTAKLVTSTRPKRSDAAGSPASAQGSGAAGLRRA